MSSPTHFTSRRSGVAVLGVFCAAGIFLASPSVFAQRRMVITPAPVQAPMVRVAPSTPSRVVQPSHVVSPAPGIHSVNRVTHPRPATRTNSVNNEHRANQNFVCANGVGVPLVGTVPGYGFNYQYLNSINSDLALKAAIDPATQLQLREAARLNCGTVGTGGYLLGGFGGYPVQEESDQQGDSEPAPATQPQVVVVQVPAAAGSQQSAGDPIAAPAEDPLPDEPLFVLVLRDGSRLEATAFTRTSDTIVYITADGLRRTIQRSDLDTDATIRVNGERGAQLQLSL